MIEFTIFKDRLSCVQRKNDRDLGMEIFEIYPADWDNEEQLLLLISALSGLKNDEHVKDTVISFEEA